MSYSVKIEDNSSEKRALHITIGVVVIGFIFYWWISGTIASLVSVAMPQSEDGKVAGMYDFIAENIGDALAFVGALAVALFTSLWRFVVQGLSVLIGWIQQKNDTPKLDDKLLSLRSDTEATVGQINLEFYKVREEFRAELEKTREELSKKIAELQPKTTRAPARKAVAK